LRPTKNSWVTLHHPASVLTIELKAFLLIFNSNFECSNYDDHYTRYKLIISHTLDWCLDDIIKTATMQQVLCTWIRSLCVVNSQLNALSIMWVHFSYSLELLGTDIIPALTHLNPFVTLTNVLQYHRNTNYDIICQIRHNFQIHTYFIAGKEVIKSFICVSNIALQWAAHKSENMDKTIKWTNM